MNRHFSSAFIIAAAMSLTSYASTQNCASDAETEYAVPTGLLSVMSSGEPSLLGNEFFGPMALSERIIPFAASGIGTPANEIKSNACQNYRAAAWLLMNKFGGNDTKDIFTAVNSYYYGPNKKEYGPVTLRIKKNYLKAKQAGKL